MFHLGFDAKRLYNNFTGLGNYSRTLLHHLSEYYPEHHYFLFSPKVKDRPPAQAFLKNPAFTTIQPTSPFKSYWRTSGLLKDLKKNDINLYHGLSHELPLGIERTDIKTVVTIHDLIIKTWPKTFPWIDRKIYDYKFASACRRADKIIAISESTKQDIIQYYQVAPRRIEVIYQTCNERFKVARSKSNISDILQKHQLPSEYLLYVGSIIERKNLLGLLEAIRSISPQQRIPLVVIGSGNAYLQLVKAFIQKHGLQGQVFFPKNISTEDLSAIYQGASVFCYPSFYEGFGIPIIEALYSKTPVLTSDLSSLPEAAGPGACYVDPHRPESIAEGIQKILSDTAYSQKLVDEGYAYVQRFNAKDLTDALMGVYRGLLE